MITSCTKLQFNTGLKSVISTVSKIKKKEKSCVKPMAFWWKLLTTFVKRFEKYGENSSCSDCLVGTANDTLKYMKASHV